MNGGDALHAPSMNGNGISSSLDKVNLVSDPYLEI